MVSAGWVPSGFCKTLFHDSLLASRALLAILGIPFAFINHPISAFIFLAGLPVSVCVQIFSFYMAPILVRGPPYSSITST